MKYICQQKGQKNAIIYAAKIIDTNLKSCKMIGRNLVQYLPHTSLHRLCCRSLDSFHQHLDVLTTTFGFNWNLHRFFSTARSFLPKIQTFKLTTVQHQLFDSPQLMYLKLLSWARANPVGGWHLFMEKRGVVNPLEPSWAMKKMEINSTHKSKVAMAYNYVWIVNYELISTVGISESLWNI